MPTADAEYQALAKRLEELRTATDPALSKERAELQKKLSEILISRRTTDRFQCHIKVDLKAGEQTGQGVLTNLGAGGAFVRTTLSLPKLTEVTLTVTALGRLPNGAVLPSNVRWEKPGDGLGVAFKTLEPAVAESLRRALGELVREQPPKLPER
jgi:PilZ domain